MILEYRIKSGSIFEEDNIRLIITISGDQTFVEQLGKLDYGFHKKLNEFIYIFTQSANRNKHAMIATLVDMSDVNEYFKNVSSLLFAIYETTGKHISVYLPSVQNFNDLAIAVVKFCEKNMDYNFKLQFFTDDKNLKTLENNLKSLELLIRNRQLELSSEIFQRFKCISCRFFAYNPSITSCCHMILCKKCSILPKCPKCFDDNKPTSLTQLNFLFDSLPYHCLCGSVMTYSEKRHHSEMCEIRWYQCKLCNKKISYSKSNQHFNENHFQAVLMDNLF